MLCKTETCTIYFVTVKRNPLYCNCEDCDDDVNCGYGSNCE